VKQDARRARAKLRAVYFDRDEYDCTPEARAIERDDRVHLHFDDEREACQALLAHRDETWRSLTLTGHFPDPRYRCIRGPGGLLRAVSDEHGQIVSHLDDQ
jgi:hypothetical protein